MEEDDFNYQGRVDSDSEANSSEISPDLEGAERAEPNDQDKNNVEIIVESEGEGSVSLKSFSQSPESTHDDENVKEMLDLLPGPDSRTNLRGGLGQSFDTRASGGAPQKHRGLKLEMIATTVSPIHKGNDLPKAPYASSSANDLNTAYKSFPQKAEQVTFTTYHDKEDKEQSARDVDESQDISIQEEEGPMMAEPIPMDTQRAF